MPFVIDATDKPDSAALRAAERPKHMAFLDSNLARLIAVGDSADGTDPGAVERALADAGIEVLPADAATVDLSIVLCADYLDPRLRIEK